MSDLYEEPVFPECSPQYVDFGPRLDGRESDERTKFMASLLPMTETPQFLVEMKDSLRIKDKETGITYGTACVNRDCSGEPLFWNLSWQDGFATKPGRHEVNALSVIVRRPIFVIDHEGHGATDIPGKKWAKHLSFDDIAAARLRIIDQLGVQSFDVGGTSMGGVVAAKTAEQAGARVGKLVTVSMPSFDHLKIRELGAGFGVWERRNQKDYAQAAHPSIRREAVTGFNGTVKNFRTLLRLGLLIRHGVLPDTISNLDANTEWHDIVGSRDEITHYLDHIAAVRTRNETTPGSSSAHVLANETHAWVMHNNAIAMLVSAALNCNPRTRPNPDRHTRDVKKYSDLVL